MTLITVCSDWMLTWPEFLFVNLSMVVNTNWGACINNQLAAVFTLVLTATPKFINRVVQ